MAFTSSEFTPIEVAMFKNFLARIRTEVQTGQLTVGENIFFSADTKPLGPELKQ